MNPEATLVMPLQSTIYKKWQEIVNILARSLSVPAALIMRLVDANITVYVSSETDQNPYRPGASEHFKNSGLYCETVIKTNGMLLVPDALADEQWKNNPDVSLNMISYLGFPIRYPDKSPFGTICVLDNKENRYSEIYKDLIMNFRDAIERDLELLELNQSLQETNSNLAKSINTINRHLEEKDILLKEVHHRIKNNIASIGGLIALQLERHPDTEAQNLLNEIFGRVEGMRLIYDKLLYAESYQSMPVQYYFNDLVKAIIAIFPESKRIELQLNCDDFSLNADVLHHVGTIINELLTNSMKYAFQNKDAGMINVAMLKSDNEITIIVEDNGTGLPSGFSLDARTSLGMMIVRLLTEQLGGVFTIGNREGGGTRSVVAFTVSR